MVVRKSRLVVRIVSPMGQEPGPLIFDALKGDKLLCWKPVASRCETTQRASMHYSVGGNVRLLSRQMQAWWHTLKQVHRLLVEPPGRCFHPDKSWDIACRQVCIETPPDD